MAIEYFCCYHSYRRKIAKLSDQEVGRLFRSLLEYSETGEAQELAGREAVAFDFIADDIDRARESYEAKIAQRAENGRKGAVNRWIANDGKNGKCHLPYGKNGYNKDKDKDKDKEEDNVYIAIVDFLNEKAGTKFKASTPKTKSAINARLSEGFTLEDFKSVITKKCAEWLGDPAMEKYLRPETLFGTKFEGYLNQKATNKPATVKSNEYNDFMAQLAAMRE